MENKSELLAAAEAFEAAWGEESPAEAVEAEVPEAQAFYSFS